jgi:hypothetical protein
MVLETVVQRFFALFTFLMLSSRNPDPEIGERINAS